MSNLASSFAGYGSLVLVRPGQFIARLLNIEEKETQHLGGALHIGIVECVGIDKNYEESSSKPSYHLHPERCVVVSTIGDVNMTHGFLCNGDHILIKRQSGYIFWEQCGETYEPYLILNASDILAVIKQNVESTPKPADNTENDVEYCMTIENGNVSFEFPEDKE